jgi:hypothetical protein
MFGGEGEDGIVYGDLWIYDIVRSNWHKILDSRTGFELNDENIDENKPLNRAFFGGELLIKYGSAIIFGGRGEDNDTFCDIWTLDVEKALQVIENPSLKIIEKLWNKMPVLKRDKNKLCRYGQKTLLINDITIFIFGGATSPDSNSAIIYDVITNKLTTLYNKNDPPSNRFYHGTIGNGNGVVLMYGGEGENGLALSEYWMLKVDLNAGTIQYIAYNPKSSYFSLIFAWREGFSLHHSPRLGHPILIGGSFGNNQQGKALLVLPTITCASKEEFEIGDCTP